MIIFNSDNMVEIFSTNIRKKMDADTVLELLGSALPHLRMNFDLDDVADTAPFCHSILRAEGNVVDVEKIIAAVGSTGFLCEILEDKICT